MQEENSCVAIYEAHLQAEAAVHQLLEAGLDVERLSIVGKGYQREEHPVGFYHTNGCMKLWGDEGNFWDRAWELLRGAAFFWVPGLGIVIIAGPLVGALVAALEGAVVVVAAAGLSVLGTALYSVGIPKESIIRYERTINSVCCLLIVHGDQEEVELAHEVLAAGDVLDLTIHLS